jgi:hypothetical protein
MNCIQLSPGNSRFEALYNGLKFSAYPEALKPLRTAQNDYLDSSRLITVLIAAYNNEPLARIALYKSDADDAQQTLILGNYESENDEAAAFILSEAENFARQHGFKKLIGPMNGSSWATYRFRTDNSSDLFFSEHWHPHSYLLQWLNAGFTTAEKYISTIDRKLTCDSPELLLLESRLLEKGLTIRALTADDFTAEKMDKLYAFSIDAFSENVLYAPITADEFRMRYEKTANYISPGSSVVIESADGMIHALMFAFPDHFCKNEKRFVLKTLARNPKSIYRGLATLLGNNLTRYARQNGYTSVIHAYMHVNNKSVSLSEKFSGEPLREYVLLEKQIA